PDFTNLTIDNSADTATRTATLTATGVTGLSPAPINWVQNDLRSLTIRGGNGSNTYEILGTPQSSVAGGVMTTLNAGSGSDAINVRATTGALTIASGAGNDSVRIGNAANRLDDVRGHVLVSGGLGSDGLSILDFGSTAA